MSFSCPPTIDRGAYMFALIRSSHCSFRVPSDLKYSRTKSLQRWRTTRMPLCLHRLVWSEVFGEVFRQGRSVRWHPFVIVSFWRADGCGLAIVPSCTLTPQACLLVCVLQVKYMCTGEALFGRRPLVSFPQNGNGKLSCTAACNVQTRGRGGGGSFPYMSHAQRVCQWKWSRSLSPF